MFQFLHKQYSLKKDYFMTAANGIAVLLGVFFLNGYIARQYGLEILGEFLLVRRTSFAIMGIILIGMNVGLPSLIGRYKNENIEWGAIIIYIMITLPIIGGIAYVINEGIVSGFNNKHSLAYALFLSGVSLQYLTYGLYRGHLKMAGANILHIVSTALIPIVTFLLVGELSISLLIIGISVILFNVVALYSHHASTSKKKIKWNSIRLILRFGLARLLSFISQFILLTGAPILVSFYNPYTDLAYFNSLISLVRLLLFVVGPLGVVLLPRIAKAIKENTESQITKGLESLLKIIILYSGLAAIFLSSIGGVILEVWLGSVSASGQWMASVLLLAIPFYLIVEIMRSPIDGFSLKGHNSIIYGAAALGLIVSFFLLVYSGVSELHAGIYSFLIGYIIAAIGSIMVIRKLTDIAFPGISYYLLTVISFVGLYAFNYLIDFMLFPVAVQSVLKLVVFLSISGIIMIRNKDDFQSVFQLSNEI